MYPEVLARVGKKYNNAYIMVEVNDIGQQVADILHYELEYENMMMSAVKGRSGQVVGGGFSKNILYGVRTTKSVKRIGCSNLKDIIENDKLLVQDADIIMELSNFVQRGSSYAAEDGQHDDLAMCCVLFAWLARQDYFREVTDTDFRAKMKDDQISMIEEDLLPFGIVHDGGVDEFSQQEETYHEPIMPMGGGFEQWDKF